MANPRSGAKLLALAFIGVCFCVGISIGLGIRSKRSQATDTNNLPNEFVPDPNSPPFIKEPSYTDTITIQAVGDVIPGTNFPNNRLPRDRNQLIPKSVRTHLKKADILFGNFETSLTNYSYTTKDISRGQMFAFRSPPSYAQMFADVGFDVLNIANNHAMDFGLVGFADTIKNLSAVGIKTLGHKNQILLLQAKNISVAMIGFAPYKRYNSIHDFKTAKKLIQEAKKRADVVIVSMHAGAEGTKALRVKNQTEIFYGENRGNAVKFARTMIDAGADLVLGHGPHVPRAMEIYKKKLIAYSLGNFLGYRTLSTKNETGYSMILEVKLNSQGDLVGGKIIPVHMNRQGIPYIDKQLRTVKLVRYMTTNDFPDTPVKINKKGEITVIN
ncbi:MAG: CapA family protein [Fischerella sp. CENA71]|nr:CapA family protein [Fischerella sp. CENA71]